MYITVTIKLVAERVLLFKNTNYQLNKTLEEPSRIIQLLEYLHVFETNTLFC